MRPATRLIATAALATFNGQANQRFKFDVKDDWTQNYGDTNKDGVAEQGGADILTPVSGQYRVRFNDQTLQYSLTPVSVGYAKNIGLVFALVLMALLDAPFYSRSLVSTRIDDEDVTGVHEALDLRRFRSPIVKGMLACRVPRRAGWRVDQVE